MGGAAKNGPRVLHVTRSTSGGLFKHIRDLARGSKELGISHGLVVGSLADSLPEVTAEALAKSEFQLGVAEVGIPRSPAPMDLWALISVVLHARRGRFDVLHGHGAKGGVYARLASRWLGIPCVYSAHGGSLHYERSSLNGRLFLAIERFLRRWTDAFLFESTWVRDEFLKKVGPPLGQAELIPHGIDRLSAQSNTPADHDFVYIGDFRQIKGLDVLLRALARLNAIGERPRLIIFGEGDDAERLKRMAKDLKIEPSVIWGGYAKSPIDALGRGRCVVIPSRRESFCYVALEAASAGRAMIATPVGAIPQIVGIHGEKVLVPPQNEEVLATRMTDFLHHPEIYEAIGTEISKEVGANWTLAQMCRETAGVYEGLVTARVGQGPDA